MENLHCSMNCGGFIRLRDARQGLMGFDVDVSCLATVVHDSVIRISNIRSPEHMHRSEIHRPRTRRQAIKLSPGEVLVRELVVAAIPSP
jgi:hypothetical protein